MYFNIEKTFFLFFIRQRYSGALVFKYLKNKEVSKDAAVDENESLENFYQFKELRNRINPGVDKSIAFTFVP